MSKCNRSVSNIFRNAIWQWYPFEDAKTVLCVDTYKEDFSNVLEEKNLDVTTLSLKDVPKEGAYDYIVCVDDLEKEYNPTEAIKNLFSILSKEGVLLMRMRNRLGIRYFCGDRDPHTGGVLDGIENYWNRITGSYSKFSGRMYAKSEIKNILTEAGIPAYKIHGVYSGIEYPSHLVADGFVPNEELNNRILPTYGYRETVYLEEEYLYSSLIENGMFHTMANAFLIECAYNKCFLSDVLYVTNSLERSRERCFSTIIHSNTIVTKHAIYKEGNNSLHTLVRIHSDLWDKGIKTVKTSVTGSVLRMPQIDAPTVQKYLQGLLYRDIDKFFNEFDRFMSTIDRASNILRYDKEYGPIADSVYIDMIPLNCFLVDEEYVFFDQEFELHNYPLNVVKARALLTFFAYHDENRFIEKDLFTRYGLAEKKSLYMQCEMDFLKKLWNESSHGEYRAALRRDTQVTIKNRARMNYPAGFLKKCFVNIFDGIEDKQCYLFGSGRYSEDFISRYGSLCSVKGVFDNDENKWGNSLNGVVIMSPDRIKEMDLESLKVFVCIKEYEPVMKQLDILGVRNYSIYDKNKTYPYPSTFAEHSAKPYHLGYCAGAFDMFHIGHLNLLRRAKEQCDILIVGVMSDERMYDLKKKYPVIPCNERMQVVAGCRYVDRVEELPADRAGIMDAWNMFHFDCMFSGDDHENDPGWLAERERLRERGSDIVFVSYTKETSSSAIREKAGF